MRQPRPSARARRGLVAASLLVAGVALTTVATGAGDDLVATVDTPAERLVRPVGEMVVVFDVGEVDGAVVEAARSAASAANGTASVSRTGSLGMRAITRGGVTVHAPPSGYLSPATYVAFPEASIGRILGPDVAPVLGPRRVVMNQLTADATGAAVGDTIVMQAGNASAVELTIAAIRPYEQLGGSELGFTYDVAERLGATYDTRVVIHDFDRERIDEAIAAEGLDDRRETQVNRSWDPPNPDSTHSTARTKVLLGVPFYRFNSDGSISIHPDWVSANLPAERELLNDTIRIRARCHVDVVDDLEAALADVAAAGLAGAIDVGNANTYGGCYVPRFSRLGDSQVGFLSKHTYGMALDTNTVTNCQGCEPQMNCEVVRIFRRHGFAWGGNFRRADGMHFEWVGERRDQIPYASDYCPNVVNASTQSGVPREIGTEVLVVGVAEAGHDH